MLSTIGGLGEFALIERVTGQFPRTDDVILGPGDDAAVVAAPDGRTVATTDLLVEGRHFRRDWSTARDVGHRAVAQNYADVAAMGARPTGLLIGFAAPAELPLAWAEEFTAGVRDECARAGGAVVGGDTVGSPTLTIAVTALGDLEGRAPVRRDGARAGDVVAYTGHLGLSAAGLALLERGVDGPAECLSEHRRPSPPYAAGPEAARLGATAMLDVSDGLVQDLGHVCRRSGVGILLDSEALRPEPALLEAVRVLGAPTGKAVDAARRLMVAGGEDHALAAVFPPEVVLPEHWHRVGTVGEAPEGGGRAAVTVDGNVVERGGWDHFRRD
ncbi:thiamine-phosphate kinase [Nocardiopsis sp. L17-MgMaSL7]|uniref:thiamine-phosphate kinase n=1 Tax=Nocardiopsis sp. L17-MgMaSL7 TaxID=1938893 RepID=UPI000D70B559|nr:thiamine-phosphate kinase [Nocardiopsis sp. L17-MgMaSL7]PWV52864.1 thiamine-phosphate kinase [Nocardiopsis sp. L17-MgMaSL7]